MAAVASKSPLVSHLNFYNNPVDDSTSRSTSTPRIEQQNINRLGEASGSRSYENIGPQDVTPSSEAGAEAPMTIDEDFPEPICGGCKKLIDEDSADAGVIHFA